jgi:hypothetical protein
LQNFYKRLQTWIEKRNENYQKDIENSSKDSKTGQKFFSPQTRSRAIKNKETSTVRNVFINLYEDTKRQSISRKETREKYDEEMKNLANSKKASLKMEEINNNNKYECFLSLFKIFDTDEDNLIANNDDFQKSFQSLEEWLQVILQPLIEEFSSQPEALNREEFVMALDQLYKAVSVGERRKLIDWYVKKVKRENSPRKRRLLEAENSNNFSFQPKISDASHKVFKDSQRYSKNVFERNSDYLKRRETFLAEKNEEKIENETKGKFYKYL